MDIQKRTLWMLGAVIAVQLVDIGIHIAADEVEPMRVLSNAVLIIGVSLGVFASQNGRMVILGSALIYVVLTLVFVALFGLVNPVSGVSRVPLFAFVALSLWLTYRVAQVGLKASPAQ